MPMRRSKLSTNSLVRLEMAVNMHTDEGEDTMDFDTDVYGGLAAQTDDELEASWRVFSSGARDGSERGRRARSPTCRATRRRR